MAKIKNIEHICEGRDERIKDSPEIWVYKAYYWSHGKPCLVATDILDVDNPITIPEIKISFCPFCGADLEKQMVS